MFVCAIGTRREPKHGFFKDVLHQEGQFLSWGCCCHVSGAQETIPCFAELCRAVVVGVLCVFPFDACNYLGDASAGVTQERPNDRGYMR